MNKFKKAYIAGALFKQGDINKRLEEGKDLRNLGMDVYNPIEAPCNDKAKLPTAEDIYWGDTKEVLDSDVIVAEIDGMDPGVCSELGITAAWNFAYNHMLKLQEALENKDSEAALNMLKELLSKYPKKEIIAHHTDIRRNTSHKYEGDKVPYGVNQYVVGLIEDNGEIVHSWEEAMEKLRIKNS